MTIYFDIFIIQRINLFKIILIISLTIIIFIEFMFLSAIKRISNEISKKKRIFTFWEPSEKMPGYLKLCIETWKKYLPEYEIKILDYKSVKYFIGEMLFSKIISNSMTLPIQADAIRVALLYKYGGIWMDTDIIILNGEFIKKLENYELAMLGEEKTKSQSIGFIYANKNCSIINFWLKNIIRKVQIYKRNLKTINNSEIFGKTRKKIISWNYLGNSIIDEYLKNTSEKVFFRIDKNEINALPETNYFKNYSLNASQKYQNFYFHERDPELILNASKNLLYLHNSWTPSKYRLMSEKEFLKQDILLSKLLVYILNKTI